MEIQSTHNNISFQKKLMATGAVKNNGKTMPVKIYMLEMPQDLKCMENIITDPKWHNGRYPLVILDRTKKNLYDFSREFLGDKYKSKNHYNIYTLEDKNDNCLGIVQTNMIKMNKVKNVELLETCPHFRHENSERKIKYIGETLMTFLANLVSKPNQKQRLEVEIPLDTARDFYTNCGLESAIKDDYFSELVLPADKVESLTKQNAKHTGRKIELTF